jgi:hypothetical protein
MYLAGRRKTPGGDMNWKPRKELLEEFRGGLDLKKLGSDGGDGDGDDDDDDG